MRKPIVAVIFAAACGVALVYGPAIYGIYLALDPPPSFSDVNREAKGDRLPLKLVAVKEEELSDGTPVEEVEVHDEEINSLPANTTRIAKQ